MLSLTFFIFNWKRALSHALSHLLYHFQLEKGFESCSLSFSTIFIWKKALRLLSLTFCSRFNCKRALSPTLSHLLYHIQLEIVTESCPLSFCIILQQQIISKNGYCQFLSNNIEKGESTSIIRLVDSPFSAFETMKLPWSATNPAECQPFFI